MKNILLTLLVAVLILGALGAAGYVGYQYGYNQGVIAATGGDGQFLGPRFGWGPGRMPMHDFGSNRGLGPYGFGMMQPGYGLWGFSLLGLLGRLLFWGLIAWAVYMLVTRSGWRITRTPPGENREP